ncbi:MULTISPECIES: NADH-quinone oxidoreductase subunit B family protein [unclassified Serratia (in: enterobacteria)]|uniref:NADH-quinone oxidoreductase subunit B family protein n=1 Tax=unclassified Serratia (in: enterobacteria) TaxID=2647522 RepID=UPI003076173A
MNQTVIGPRDAHGLPIPIALDDSIQQLKTTLLLDIRRSAYVYRVDCGGCNGCEIEIFAAISPLFDAERFGIKVVPSPRHADILLFTGAVTRAMRIPAIRAWQAAPDPKICISYGACGNSGGIFHDLYCVWGGTDSIVPVDVYIPGCPPTPAATIYGFAMALGLLDQKIKGQQHDETQGAAAILLHPQVPQPLRVLLDREARRMAGYRYGRQIADQFMQLLTADDPLPVEQRISAYLQQQDDLRLSEIIGNLQAIYQRVQRGELRL